jgi:hypothetical protein
MAIAFPVVPASKKKGPLVKAASCHDGAVYKGKEYSILDPGYWLRAEC